MAVYAVIMAGGSGTRFWPLSREKVPKQCLNIAGKNSLIQDTVSNLKKLIPEDNFYINTVSSLHDILKKQIPFAKFLLEPLQKNTAACIGLACIHLLHLDPDAIIVAETADHYYTNPDLYLEHIQAAIDYSEDNNIVLVGIPPTYPSTGFGYIEHGDFIELIEASNPIEIFSVKQFVEKPNLETAKSYLNSGTFLWNSGTFVSRADVMLEEFKKHLPNHYENLIKLKEVLNSKDDFIIKQKTLEVFKALENISIDYGIMEKSDNVVVVRGDFPWDDVGSWTSLERMNKKDKHGNIVLANYLGVNSRNNIIYSTLSNSKNLSNSNKTTSKKLITTIGVEDLVIVETEDCIMICPKHKCEDIKLLVDKLKNNDKEEYL